ERPGLLPTNVNPWTAVVCCLNFRTSPIPPEYAAVFHFFSVAEWKELAEGGGRLRELTERLIPGFPPELLRAQIEVMRRRAEQRLGSKFEALLGQRHQFKELSSELIADYVSAGEESARRGSGRRHFSDVTRTADLYFADGPFAFPVTLIDTPRTNDPFLVRDEITRRSLENPDIYVFVISALQPLAVSDIGMLRLLNGLHKDRIIVFINRADQLPHPQTDAPLIKAAVEKRLSMEFPALRIPVVYGSAWLGNLALEAGAARHAGMTRAPAQGFEAPQPRPATSRAPLSSGMREVSAAITKMMGTSSLAMVLRQIAVCVAELVRSADAADHAEVNAIEEALVARLKDASVLRARIGEEEKSLALFEERADSLRKSFRQIEDHLN